MQRTSYGLRISSSELVGSMGIKMQRICKKCLIKDTPQKEYFQNMYDYIDRLDTDIKVADTIYTERLNACKTCPYLQCGMCKICGCFVEVRAAIKSNDCPAIEKYW